MRRKLLAVLLATTLLCGCNTDYNAGQDLELKSAGNYFTKVNSWNDDSGYYSIVYANDTHVKYLTVSTGYKFGITPLYNSDGTLQIYGEEVY